MVSSASALTAEWTQWKPSQRVTPRRSGHASFVVDKTPYVFGGYAEDDSGENKDMPFHRFVVNDLWKFSDKEWSLQEPTGDIPGPRLVAAMAAVDSNSKEAYLLGGWDPGTAGDGGVMLDTVHRLDVGRMAWKKLDTLLPDGPTSRHVAVTLANSNKILMHTHRCDNYVWLLDPATDTFHKQLTTGPCPSSRGLHAATMVDETRMVLFGGAAQDQAMSNESFVLDTTTWTWTKLDPGSSSSCPSPRAGPSLCRLNDNVVLLFGGAEPSETGLNPLADLWALSLDTGEWTLLLDKGPPPRNAATLTEIDDPDGGFLLTGGWAPFRETWDDCYILRVNE